MPQQWPHQNEVDAFYGNPRGEHGDENPTWVRDHIVRVKAPWQLVTSWDEPPLLVKGIRIHEKCAESLTRVLQSIWQASGQNEATIQYWGMHLYGGGFLFKMKKSGHSLSMHSYGCAVDFDPKRNGFRDPSPNFKNIPQVVDAFESEGWTWGGRWTNPCDGMHFQAAHLNR